MFFLTVATQVVRTQKEVFYEQECLKHGGICMEREKCPPGKLSDIAGLCPIQQAQGVDCCFGSKINMMLTRQR